MNKIELELFWIILNELKLTKIILNYSEWF